jgi:hypothetical protein
MRLSDRVWLREPGPHQPQAVLQHDPKAAASFQNDRHHEFVDLARSLWWHVVLVSHRRAPAISSRAMWPLIRRVLTVGAGLFILVANSGGEEGSFLGLYPLDSAERIGWDVSKVAIALLGLWIIVRGIGILPRRKPSEKVDPAQMSN